MFHFGGLKGSETRTTHFTVVAFSLNLWSKTIHAQMAQTTAAAAAGAQTSPFQYFPLRISERLTRNVLKVQCSYNVAAVAGQSRPFALDVPHTSVQKSFPWALWEK